MLKDTIKLGDDGIIPIPVGLLKMALESGGGCDSGPSRILSNMHSYMRQA